MLNPNQGFKKIVQKLKARYKVTYSNEFAPDPLTELFGVVRDQQRRIDHGESVAVAPSATRSTENALHRPGAPDYKAVH